MFKNRFILVLGVLSLVLVTMAVSKPFSNTSSASAAGANDFYQRHPGWTWANKNPSAGIPVTGGVDLSDYYLRHPELRVSSGAGIDTSDYFLRHPELHMPAITQFSAEQIQREYVLGERYGVMPQQDTRDKSYRPPLDECFDVPLREVASCRNASQVPVPSYRSPLDVCSDAGLIYRAECLSDGQKSTP